MRVAQMAVTIAIAQLLQPSEFNHYVWLQTAHDRTTKAAPQQLQAPVGLDPAVTTCWQMLIAGSTHQNADISARNRRRIGNSRDAYTSTRPRRPASSSRSAALATLTAGLVIWAATSRARVMHCGLRMERRSATSEPRLLAEKARPEPTFSRLTASAQIC